MKYRVTLETSASTTVEVEADSVDEARAKAEEEVYVHPCWQCSGVFDLNDVWEPVAVYDDETNEEVWAPTPTQDTP